MNSGFNYTDFYYNFIVGETPNDEKYSRTKKTFDYLKDSGLTSQEIISTIAQLDNKEEITPEDLPDSLWENSLLRRNTFYFSRELQILSPPPTWDTCFPFFLEMKIKYTLEDALNYFITKLNVNSEWINKEKELGSIKYLLKDYIKFDFVEPIDFFLKLIDYVASLNLERTLTKVYDLRDFEIDFATTFKSDVTNSKILGKNKIVWR